MKRVSIGREKVGTVEQTDKEDSKLEKEERALWAWTSTVHYPALLTNAVPFPPSSFLSTAS